MDTVNVCYQHSWGFTTMQRDLPAPEDWIAVFDVNLDEVESIKQGAELKVENGELVIIPIEVIEEEIE